MSTPDKKIRTALERFYKIKVDTLLGFDMNDLTSSKSKVSLRDCSGCAQPFTVSDCGLEEDNVALFWRMCEKLSSSFYCAGYEKDNSEKRILYRFCYNEPCIEVIKNAILKTDSIRCIDCAVHNTLKICLKRIGHHKDVTEDFIRRSFEGSCNSNLSQRKAMWHEIKKGVRRLIVMPSKKWKNEDKIEGTFSLQNGLPVRALHGNQLRRLVRTDRYNVDPIRKPDILCLGHYHLLMVLREFETWILMTGHYLSYKPLGKIGFLSHIGSPILSIEKGSGKPFFRLVRGSES
jgi:hypothetical protein